MWRIVVNSMAVIAALIAIQKIKEVRMMAILA
jgi:hypothetical protein